MKCAQTLLTAGGILGLIAAAGLAAPALKERPAANPLLGRWMATGMHISGMPNTQWMGLEYEFTPDGRWLIYRDGAELTERPRSFVSDAKTKVPAIDLTEGKEQYLGVYQVGPGGDTLTVSFNTNKESTRPTGIEPDGATMTITFKRMNAK